MARGGEGDNGNGGRQAVSFDAALFHRHLANKRNNLKALEGALSLPSTNCTPRTLHALNVKSSNWQIDGTHMHLRGEGEQQAPRRV